jgi:hypothetical protein
MRKKMANFNDDYSIDWDQEAKDMEASKEIHKPYIKDSNFFNRVAQRTSSIDVEDQAEQ